jgi:hypothetical protein
VSQRESRQRRQPWAVLGGGGATTPPALALGRSCRGTG